MAVLLSVAHWGVYRRKGISLFLPHTRMLILSERTYFCIVMTTEMLDG